MPSSLRLLLSPAGGATSALTAIRRGFLGGGAAVTMGERFSAHSFSLRESDRGATRTGTLDSLDFKLALVLRAKPPVFSVRPPPKPPVFSVRPPPVLMLRLPPVLRVSSPRLFIQLIPRLKLGSSFFELSILLMFKLKLKEPSAPGFKRLGEGLKLKSILLLVLSALRLPRRTRPAVDLRRRTFFVVTFLIEVLFIVGLVDGRDFVGCVMVVDAMMGDRGLLPDALRLRRLVLGLVLVAEGGVVSRERDDRVSMPLEPDDTRMDVARLRPSPNTFVPGELLMVV